MKPVIFIPTYNCEESIAQTLDSLMVQKGVDKFPICVVDNASTDNTAKIARKYQDVEVFKNKENIGRVQNWNKCLDIFRKQEGFDCMKFVFAGDRLKRDCLRSQLIHISEQTPIVTCAHEVKRKQQGDYIMRHFDTQRVLTPEESLRTAEKKGNWIAGCMACPMFTKEALGNLHFNEHMKWISDWLFWTMLSERGNIKYLDKALVEFTMDARKHYATLAYTSKAQQEELFVKIYIEDILFKK